MAKLRRHQTKKGGHGINLTAFAFAFSTPILKHIGTENADISTTCIVRPTHSDFRTFQLRQSTLAEALSRKLGIPAVHLDQLHHLSNTDWQPRPKEEFHALQREAISGETWVMDGNYSALTVERLARATGAIVLDDNHWLRLGRYFNRTLFQRHRPGALEGKKDSIKWEMIHWVAIASRHNGERYREMVDQTGLPRVFCGSMREVNGLYEAWGLTHAGGP